MKKLFTRYPMLSVREVRKIELDIFDEELTKHVGFVKKHRGATPTFIGNIDFLMDDLDFVTINMKPKTKKELQ